MRAYGAFPALMLTLERAGVTSAGTMSAMAARAQTLNEIGDDQTRTMALSAFQASLGILDRIIRSGSLSRADADGLIGRLATRLPRALARQSEGVGRANQFNPKAGAFWHPHLYN